MLWRLMLPFMFFRLKQYIGVMGPDFSRASKRMDQCSFCNRPWLEIRHHSQATRRTCYSDAMQQENVEASHISHQHNKPISPSVTNRPEELWANRVSLLKFTTCRHNTGDSTTSTAGDIGNVRYWDIGRHLTIFQCTAGGMGTVSAASIEM
ncbi:hypothetical protein HRR83_001079 [Exophiala dermatitidis]|uniref:Uncharacterized protein n=1 Tax=Exophiala dermatitidis TaxID=5970 RepID=A0AAN6EZ34_EXODE|nr:hypothetical protein HRR74_001083 [Exophiala dermatitidis]KAJ4527163.1 hypothetical protein HRR73_001960 [Exophiala dermatitidis]KAJ4532884.1 hypothetical protein HRR76_007861 [Exophiala dermatitidis]KAJ4538847.1 hypothetical protein HRR77_006770 [Exophiala dermatitidis]KAJ4574028.1 hypothetical protein HRR79_003033 [Exophiala dermatitidis]